MIIKTTPGKTYVVESDNGCTVKRQEASAAALTVEAGAQGYFVATAQEYEVSDDAARVVQVFKLAPQQKLALLGVLGGNAGGSELPARYKRVEYLESTGTQYIDTLVEMKPRLRFAVDFISFSPDGATATYYVFGGFGGGLAYSFGYTLPYSKYADYGWMCAGENNSGWRHPLISYAECVNKRQYVCVENNRATIDGVEVVRVAPVESNSSFTEPSSIGLFTHIKNYIPVRNGKHRVFGFKIHGDGGYKVLDLIPCIDTKTGSPCMFDLVSRKTFYNAGTGDFIYPTESTTYSLRRVLPDWGKLTERGLRRLYHAPADWQGELYDYALENGYKPIIEPEMPEDGYWVPQWRETEDEIILDWVETDPPEEEFLTIPTEQ